MLSPSRASAIIVYDITDAQSFENARGWFSPLRMLGEPGVVVGLAGSKADLAEERRAVPHATAAAFAAEHGMVHFETSSKLGLNVEELFVAMGRRMPQREAARAGSLVSKLFDAVGQEYACSTRAAVCEQTESFLERQPFDDGAQALVAGDMYGIDA